MRAAALIICLLALAAAPASAQTIIVLDDGGPPPGPAFVTDDFSSGLGNWTQLFGSWATAADQLDNTAPSAKNHIEHNSTRTANQWVSFKFVDMSNDLGGLMLRHDGSGTGYFFRINNGTGNFRWAKTTDNCDSNSKIQQDVVSSPALDNGDYFGVSVVGTGAATVVSYWDFGPTAPGLYSTWGPPDATMTTDPGAKAVDGAGKIGVCAPGNLNLNRWDDFQAGDI